MGYDGKAPVLDSSLPMIIADVRLGLLRTFSEASGAQNFGEIEEGWGKFIQESMVFCT